MGSILLAGEESHECSTLECAVISDRSPQHGIAGFEGVEHRTLGDLSLDVQRHLAINPRQRPQMCRKHDSYHGSVWTSTDKTGGRSRTIAVQLSPAFAEPYTCPPDVPK